MNNFSIHKPPGKEEKAIEVLLKNEITLQNALLPLKEQISQYLDGSHHIYVRSEGPLTVDIAFVQLITALRQTLQKKGANLQLDIQLDQRSQDLMTYSNLLSVLK